MRTAARSAEQSSRGRSLQCTVEVWCTFERALGPSQDSWIRVRSTGYAVLISGSCLRRQNGGIWCWEFDEAAAVLLPRLREFEDPVAEIYATTPRQA